MPRLFVEPVAQSSPKPAQEFLPHATANAAREDSVPRASGSLRTSRLLNAVYRPQVTKGELSQAVFRFRSLPHRPTPCRNWAVDRRVLFEQATMIKTILSAFALLPLLVSAAPASPVTQGFQLESPYGILKVKTADDEDSRIRSRWREDHGDADWYDGRQDDRAEALKRYSYRPPSDDSDCFTVERVWYCP